MRLVREVGPQLRIGQRTAEGGHIPQQKRHQDECERQDQDSDQPFLRNRGLRGNHRGLGRILCASHSTSTTFLTNLESQISNSQRILCALNVLPPCPLC